MSAAATYYAVTPHPDENTDFKILLQEHGKVLAPKAGWNPNRTTLVPLLTHALDDATRQYSQAIHNVTITRNQFLAWQSTYERPKFHRSSLVSGYLSVYMPLQKSDAGGSPLLARVWAADAVVKLVRSRLSNMRFGGGHGSPEVSEVQAVLEKTEFLQATYRDAALEFEKLVKEYDLGTASPPMDVYRPAKNFDFDVLLEHHQIALGKNYFLSDLTTQAARLTNAFDDAISHFCLAMGDLKTIRNQSRASPSLYRGPKYFTDMVKPYDSGRRIFLLAFARMRDTEKNFGNTTPEMEQARAAHAKSQSLHYEHMSGFESFANLIQRHDKEMGVSIS